MKPSIFALVFVIGVAVGIGAALLFSPGGPDAIGPTGEDARVEELERRSEASAKEIAALEEQVQKAEAELALSREKAAAEPPPDMDEPTAGAAEDPERVESSGKVTATYEDLQKAVEDLGKAFQEYIVDGTSQRASLLSLFKRADPEAVTKLMDEFEATSDLGQKTMMAHVLANSGKDEAIRLLSRIVRDPQKGFMERRIAIHGLAFSNHEGLDPLLEETARGESERGVRANAAFGLARRGSDVGVELYATATDEAFAEKDPVASQYLSGFYLMGERALPAVRERIRKYEDRQARILLIELVKSKKDRGALSVLYEVMNDPEGDASVKKAAEAAIKEIEKE